MSRVKPIITALFLYLSPFVHGQSSTDSIVRKFEAGICAKKMVGLYWLNGISLTFHPRDFLRGHFKTGVNFTSSSLGSAIGSRAIPLHIIEVFAHYHWRKHRHLQPFVSLNAGYGFAVFDQKNFDALPNAMFLVSPEAGVSWQLKLPLRFSFSGGYNILTGNGMQGLGLIYPLYFQGRLLYQL